MKLSTPLGVVRKKGLIGQWHLVWIVRPLPAWLRQFRTFTEGKLYTLHEVTCQQHFAELWTQAKVRRKPNGLRHAFCSYHFALHANENLTAAQAGNSLAMIHAHYKGLATKAESRKWLAEKPKKNANVVTLHSAAGN